MIKLTFQTLLFVRLVWVFGGFFWSGFLVSFFFFLSVCLIIDNPYAVVLIAGVCYCFPGPVPISWRYITFSVGAGLVVRNESEAICCLSYSFCFAAVSWVLFRFMGDCLD